MWNQIPDKKLFVKGLLTVGIFAWLSVSFYLQGDTAAALMFLLVLPIMVLMSMIVDSIDL